MVSLFLVLVVALWESERLTSPGALHPSHAGVTELQGKAGCVVCHGDNEISMADACLVCHDSIHEQIIASGGLHGSLELDKLMACEACHKEHAGGALPLVADFSFHKSDIADPDHYDHRYAAEFNLTGRHKEIACEQCHLLATAEALEAGQRRFLGLGQDCSSCHEDPHEGGYGADCASCHGQEHPFENVAEFNHISAFPLTGGHDDLACKSCHEDRTKFSIVALQKSSSVEPRLCAECHNSPHWPAFIRGVAFISGRPQNDTCSLCHDPESKSFLSPAAEMPQELHQATGFPLDAPHHEQSCDQCHETFGHREPLPDTVDLQSRFAVLFPGRSQKDCRACHGDPHEGQFDAGPTKGLCIACHEATHFAPSTYSIDQHAEARFPLTGAHQAVACIECHKMDGDMLRFVPITSVCADCHEDVHGGIFDGPDKPVVVAGREGCARCHVTSSFSEMQLTSQEHGFWTGYPLRGAHVTALCIDCHKPEVLPDKRGRTFGHADRDCAACHENPHAGQFRAGERTDCARCHSDETETFIATLFDHQRDSRFSLDEHHRTLDCSACHKPISLPSGGEVVRYLPLGMECADCHDTRRLKEFERQGRPGL